ncbi:T9SS type A sorting domain-containing protein [Gelidibacter mesophilus]|uniref:T9SS type A sorting domain-containing protein n=1 Tax=Gelidibacter mesophilus TaxID=169050 RepID=UPI0003F5ACD8|nr:T9SS type A sorting domain-containing protein [Gelidibacter mesophilus]
MKKITLIIVLLFGTLAFAQEIDIIDRPIGSTTSVISAEGGDGTGVYAADSFTVTEGFGLNSITFHGFFSNGTGISFTTAFNVIIYANNEGTPGFGFQPQIADAGVVELKGIASENYAITGEGQNQSITINLSGANGGESPTLVAGTYWMVIYPSVVGSPTDEGRWNWYLSSSEAPFEALLIDPQDLFQAGATDWASIGDLIGEPANSFAWTMKGSPALGVNENKITEVSVYPNPAHDLISVKMPANIEVTNVSLYDVLGKTIKVALNNRQINVSHLSKGLYIMMLETNAGTMTKKIIIE